MLECYWLIKTQMRSQSDLFSSIHLLLNRGIANQQLGSEGSWMAKEVIIDVPSGVLDRDRWRPIASTDEWLIHQSGSDGSWMAMDRRIEQMAHSLIYNLRITLALYNWTSIWDQSNINSTSLSCFKQRIRRILVSTEILEAEGLANDVVTWSGSLWFIAAWINLTSFANHMCGDQKDRLKESIKWISKSNMLCDGDIVSVSNLRSTCNSSK